MTRGEGRVMVEIDVREHSDLRSQQFERAVRLVALRDEPPVPRPRVRAELGHRASDEKRRVETELVEAERDHRRGGRLAVRASHDDGPSRRHDLGEQLTSRAPRHEPCVRGRDHGLPAGRRRGRRRGDRDLHVLELLEVRRLVAIPAGDLRSPRTGDDGQRAHARAADADEPEPPAVKRRQARAPRRRSPRRRPAWLRDASLPSSPRGGRGRPEASARGPERHAR